MAPPLAQAFGWVTVYDIAAAAIGIPMVVIVIFSEEPCDPDKHATFKQHIACLFEKDGWTFSLRLAVTFAGIIGLATFLPTYYYDQFAFSKVQAGQLTILAAFMSATQQMFGGWISDYWGGINTLSAVLVTIAGTQAVCGFAGRSLPATTLPVMLCFLALGAGNGAVFQLVPLRWLPATAVAGSMIGEIGSLG